MKIVKQLESVTAEFLLHSNGDVHRTAHVLNRYIKAYPDFQEIICAAYVLALAAKGSDEVK